MKVLAIAKSHTNLNELILMSKPLSSSGPCGAVGKIIATSVISGGGKAHVDLNLIKMATDTQDGVEAIFDNFEIYNASTRETLIHQLLLSLK